MERQGKDKICIWFEEGFHESDHQFLGLCCSLDLWLDQLLPLPALSDPRYSFLALVMVLGKCLWVRCEFPSVCSVTTSCQLQTIFKLCLWAEGKLLPTSSEDEQLWVSGVNALVLHSSVHLCSRQAWPCLLQCH